MPLTVIEDHSAEYADRMEEATNAGLKAAAYVYYNEVKRALAGGYTSGDFVTGRVLNSVTVGDVQDHAIDVGTDVMYALYWEIGHHNIFTRKYEQVEIWRPVLDAVQDEMSDVFAGVARAYLEQGAL